MAYRIFDTTGRSLAYVKTGQEGQVKIYLTRLEPGTYLLFMYFERERKLYKFVKQ